MLLRAGGKLKSIAAMVSVEAKNKEQLTPPLNIFPIKHLEPSLQHSPAYWPNSNMPPQCFPGSTLAQRSLAQDLQDLAQRLLQRRDIVNFQGS